MTSSSVSRNEEQLGKPDLDLGRWKVSRPLRAQLARSPRDRSRLFAARSLCRTPRRYRPVLVQPSHQSVQLSPSRHSRKRMPVEVRAKGGSPYGSERSPSRPFRGGSTRTSTCSRVSDDTRGIPGLKGKWSSHPCGCCSIQIQKIEKGRDSRYWRAPFIFLPSTKKKIEHTKSS